MEQPQINIPTISLEEELLEKIDTIAHSDDFSSGLDHAPTMNHPEAEVVVADIEKLQQEYEDRLHKTEKDILKYQQQFLDAKELVEKGIEIESNTEQMNNAELMVKRLSATYEHIHEKSLETKNLLRNKSN